VKAIGQRAQERQPRRAARSRGGGSDPGFGGSAALAASSRRAWRRWQARPTAFVPAAIGILAIIEAKASAARRCESGRDLSASIQGSLETSQSPEATRVTCRSPPRRSREKERIEVRIRKGKCERATVIVFNHMLGNLVLIILAPPTAVDSGNERDPGGVRGSRWSSGGWRAYRKKDLRSSSRLIVGRDTPGNRSARVSDLGQAPDNAIRAPRSCSASVGHGYSNLYREY